MGGGIRRDSLLRVVLPLSASGLVTTAIYTPYPSSESVHPAALVHLKP